MDASDDLSTAIAVLALAAAAWGLVYSRRSAAAADRSAAAAERSAAAAEALVPPPPPPVTWRLERVDGILYRLRNKGQVPATGVRITGRPDEAADLVRVDGQPQTIPAGEAIEVTIFRELDPPVTALRVECAELPAAVTVPVR